MSDPLPIDMSGSDHIVGPPIIDFLAHDEDLRSYVVEFVPDPQVSRERKESVYIRDATATARRVGELLVELAAILGAKSNIVRIAHAGSGNFDFRTEKNEFLELHDSPSPQCSFDVYAILQVLSQEVQLEFLNQRRLGRVAS